MKQIIEKDPNGNICRKYYINHLNQKNGLCINYYWDNGNIFWKINYLNDKLFGLDYWYDKNNNKPTIISYNL